MLRGTVNTHWFRLNFSIDSIPNCILSWPLKLTKFMNNWLIFSICKCFFLLGGVGGTLSRQFLCSLLVVSLFIFKQLLDFFSLGGTIWPLWVLTRDVWESLNPFLLFFLVLGGTIKPLWVLTNSLPSSFLPIP